ncbi:MAG: hypothetical protein COW51_02675 [Candidatus Moranbacteria bacterium CG17_big_fil_post_rev_8_21_14_2_50_44_12]|nr:MAG: hypothetical protein COW51_02675 [Candidatus Moranbacteria bacterium CG17_big_fil_post_rev_8_21_14_2_50_44_12]
MSKNKMESLFWGSSSVDLKITLFLLSVSLVVSLIVLVAARRKFLAVVTFSILGNISFLLNIGSGMFRVYHILWLKYFSVFLWPILNILLIIHYARTKPKK